MMESIQILQRFSSEPGSVALPDGARTRRKEGGFFSMGDKILTGSKTSKGVLGLIHLKRQKSR